MKRRVSRGVPRARGGGDELTNRAWLREIRAKIRRRLVAARAIERWLVKLES